MNNKSEVNAAYKPSKRKELQMRIHEVKKNDEEWLEQGCRNEGKVAHAFLEFKYKFIEMLSEFELKWEGDLGRIAVAKIRIELSSVNAKPAHSGPYREGPNAREF